jgi:hypothetical protein
MENQIQRPALLTVLCVLTIVWSGLSVFLSLTQIPTLYVPTLDNPQLQVSMERLKELNPEMAKGMVSVIAELDQHKLTNWMLSFVGNCFSLMGGLMMWHLQKRGFYIYAAAELIPTTITLFTSGLTQIASHLGPMGPLVESVLALIVALIFITDLVFIFLYRMNLKHMS